MTNSVKKVKGTPLGTTADYCLDAVARFLSEHGATPNIDWRI